MAKEGVPGLSEGAAITTDDDAEDLDEAGATAEEVLAAGEDEDGEESDADAESTDEPDESEDGSQEPEDADEPDEVAEGEGGEPEKAKPSQAQDDPETLKKRIRELEAGFSQALSLIPRQQQAPAAPDPAVQRETEAKQAAQRELTEAAEILCDSSLTPEQRKEQLARFPVAVQRSALERIHAAEKSLARQAIDPVGWAREQIAPVLDELLKPHLQDVRAVRGEIALKDYVKRYSDVVESETGSSRLWDLLNAGIPPEVAGQIARKELLFDSVQKKKQKVDAKELDQKRTRESRRAQGSRKPDHRGHKRPAFTGRERTFEDFLAAEDNAEE